MKKQYEYEIIIRSGESWTEFCTRIAQEIKNMDCAIDKMDIDTRNNVCTITYHYE